MDWTMMSKHTSDLTDDTLSFKFFHLCEPIFQALNIAVLATDRRGFVVYRNSVFERQSRNMNGRHFILPLLSEMVEDILNSQKNLERYHTYNEKLYRVIGLNIEETDRVLFILDDRAASDDLNNLMRHKQQMESVSYLAAGFAHELRNPLSVIRGFVQLSALTDNVNKYYRTILSEIDRMNAIIEDFLSLSRKESAKESYDPHEFFYSILNLLRSECLLRNIRLKFRFEKADQKISLNRSMVKQVVLNLLRNAIEAFEEKQKGKVFTLEGAALKEGYRLVISDNGPGMTKEVLKQLGKPFFTTKKDGTGIGLSLCQKIMQDHGGRMSIDSTLGKGTSITLFFPYYP